jgi:hypothetical protein
MADSAMAGAGGGAAVGINELSDDELTLIMQLLRPVDVARLEVAWCRARRVSTERLESYWGRQVRGLCPSIASRALSIYGQPCASIVCHGHPCASIVYHDHPCASIVYP